jgi:putative MATE family efflux protein
VAGDDDRVDMTTGAVGSRLTSLAWPLVAGNLLQTVYNLADMFWVGRVSAEAVAAVSLMFPTAFLFISVGLGVNAAANAVISQHVGAGEDRAAENAVAQSVLLALAAAVVLALVGFAVRRPLVALIGAEGLVYDAALAYIRVIFVSIPFTFLFFVFRASLRAAGDTRTAMWLVVVSAGLNVVIDPVFILGWGPVPAMGTEGAAVATLISRGVAAVAGLYVLVSGGWGIALRVGDLTPDVPVLRRLVDVGAPAAGDGLTRSLAAVVFAALVAPFGNVAIAAYGIGIRLMSVTWTVSGAVGQAAATGVGQNLGAGQPDRASRVTWVATGGTMALLAAVGAAVFAFPAPAIRVFVDEAPVVAEGVDMMRINAPFWPLFGGLMVVQGAFRGAGSTRAAFALSLMSRWAFRIPAVWLLAYYLPYAEDGLWWAFSVSAVLSFFVGVAWFRRGTWQGTVTDDSPGGPPEGPAPPDEAGDAAVGPDAGDD